MTTQIRITKIGGNKDVEVVKNGSGIPVKVLTGDDSFFEAYVFPGTEFLAREKEG